MKKALQISISGTLFTFEEDAYTKLDSYFNSVKNHFKNTIGKEEIINDIEARVAEQLLESKEKIITLATIEKIISIMGKVEDFEDGEIEKEGSTPKSDSETASKKLYRNPDDQMIAGVCSGLAAYLGIESIWVRLAFILLTFGSGFGILLYIILWVLIPEAKTTSQKMEMKGEKVTLESLSETVKERVEEVKSKPDNIFNRFFKIVGKIIRTFVNILVPAIRIVIGVILLIISLAGLTGIAMSVGFLVSNSLQLIENVSLQSLLPGGQYFVVLGAAALAVLAPVIFLLLGAISILRKKNAISVASGLSILGIWFLALLGTGFGVARIADKYNVLVENAPEYREVEMQIPLTGKFNKIEIKDGISLNLKKNSEDELRAKGREKVIQSVEAKIENGTLYLERKPIVNNNSLCLFCSIGNLELTLETPNINELKITHGSSVYSSDFPEDADLKLDLTYGSNANLSLSLENLETSLSHGSNMTVSGDAKNAKTILQYGSNFEGDDFKVSNMQIHAKNGSSAYLNASTTLNAIAEYGSNISYSGSPSTTIKELTGSVISPR